MTESESIKVYQSAFRQGLRPDPDMSVATWSNEFRFLSQKGSAEPGPYRIERTPYLQEIAEVLSPSHPAQRIVFMKSAQCGASELGFNWIGFIMHMAPAPILMVQPTTELAEKVSKQRIAGMISDTPVLKELIGPEKSRTSGQTVLLKEFRGGVLSLTGANSPVGLRSMPARFCFLDEIDAYPQDVANEGDPVSLAEKRTQTFARRKIFLVSTPTTKDASRIELEYEKTDQRRYFVPCPECGHYQHLKWRQIKWTDDNPQTAVYECEACSHKIEERHKTQMLALGEWRATAQGDGRTIGYHINALYSPLGWKSWADVVEEFLKSKADAPLLKTWTNTVLGETWEESYSAKLGVDQLQARAEIYEPGTAPKGVLFLTAGVDVQDNRFAISVYGWGKEEESWVISHQEIFGDPSRPEIWKQLETVLDQPVKMDGHQPMPIRCACIDSGGSFTHEVYAFTRERRQKNWLAIKGQSQRGKPAIGKPTRVDINFKGQTLKSGALVYPVGSDTVKSVLYGRLKHNEAGPGFIHFHAGLGPEWFEQITAERQQIRYVKGFPIKEWVKRAGARNEALDCAVYAYAAATFILNQYNRKTVWEQLERQLNEKTLKSDQASAKPQTGQLNEQQWTIRPSGRSFVSSW